MSQAQLQAPKGFRPSQVLDASGTPMGYVGGPSHHAADVRSQELAHYNPRYVSADAAYLPERKKIMSRVQDLARNDGWTQSTINRYVDQAIGAQFRLTYLPDHVALNLDIDTLLDFTMQVESAWSTYTQDPRNFVDATARHSWAQIVNTAFRHRMRDGEAFGVLEWRDRPHFKWRTAVRIVSPDRVSNPNDAEDTDTLRAGVETNTYGEPIRYHFRVTHPGDMVYGASDTYKWEAIDRRTPWGRARVLHAFEPEEAHQTRGKSGLAAVVKRVFMTHKYADAEMQAALVNALLAAYIETPLSAEGILDAFGSGEGQAYQTERSSYHESSKLTLNGMRIPILFPGEKVNFLDAVRPNASFAGFEQNALRYFAAATGQSYAQLSADYSDANYSSLRAAILESWKFLTARRDHFSFHFCTPIFAAWMEESVYNGILKLPKGAPAFWDAFAAYTQCEWTGPGRGWVDPVKEATASQIRVDSYLSSEQTEAAEAGASYATIIQKQAQARELRRRFGLPESQSREIGTGRGGGDPSTDPNADPDEADNRDNQKRKARTHSMVPQVPVRR